MKLSGCVKSNKRPYLVACWSYIYKDIVWGFVESEWFWSVFRMAMWRWVQTPIVLDEVSASFKNCLITKPLMYKPTSPSNLVLAVSKNNFDDKLVCWKADRAKNLEVSNMPYLHKLVNSPQSLFET